MAHIFEVIDKTSRKIYLSKERRSHITSQQSLHSYMSNYLDEIKITLVKPDSIISSIYDDSKAIYYKYYKDKNQYLKVIVRYINGEGFVITSYFVRSLK